MFKVTSEFPLTILKLTPMIHSKKLKRSEMAADDCDCLCLFTSPFGCLLFYISD